jgi:hypothetical protein
MAGWGRRRIGSGGVGGGGRLAMLLFRLGEGRAGRSRNFMTTPCVGMDVLFFMNT